MTRRMVGDHPRAKRDVPLQPRPPQVEPAITQAERLVDSLLVQLERKRRAAGDDLEAVDLHLHLAGRESSG